MRGEDKTMLVEIGYQMAIGAQVIAAFMEDGVGGDV